jgi:hypothetical protein
LYPFRKCRFQKRFVNNAFCPHFVGLAARLRAATPSAHPSSKRSAGAGGAPAWLLGNHMDPPGLHPHRRERSGLRPQALTAVLNWRHGVGRQRRTGDAHPDRWVPSAEYRTCHDSPRRSCGLSNTSDTPPRRLPPTKRGQKSKGRAGSMAE